MSRDIEHATDSAETVFSAADYFLGIAQRIASSRDNTRVVLPGKGEVSLFPARKEYSANISNMAEFCLAPATQFEVVALGDTAQPPGSGKHIGELLWHAGFHASQGRLLEGTSRYDVVQFRRWPNLTRLPMTQNTARICALLTRHPTTIMLVHRQLGISKEEVYHIYSAAHSAGIASPVSRNPQAPDETAQTGSPEPAQERSLLRSLFAKISGL
ncbi:MAG: hypothetical protein HY016_06100 [Nitrosomonadales bacterium]|nr:hypothetical protein [Nitrosomonadales bacterium]